MLRHLRRLIVPLASTGTDHPIAGMGAPDSALVLLTDEGRVLAASVRVASTFNARRKGLLDRDGLDPDDGLLLSPGGSIHTFGMRATIDVLFLDEHLRVLKYVPCLRPGRIALAPWRTRYVLELAEGRAAEAEIGAGTQLAWLECGSGGDIAGLQDDVN
jgi:uncharacterized membrane protein (UPF0127 family)